MPPPQTYLAQLSHFSTFLLVYTHTILYLRSLYPQTSFLHSRFHNTSVYQSRHPAVCEWIRDAISAVHKELLSGTVSRIAVVIFHCSNTSATGDVKIMERYMLDVAAFPVVEKGMRNAGIEWEDEPADVDVGKEKGKGKTAVSFSPSDQEVHVDVSEQFRAALLMVNTRCSKLKPLPKECSFNISIELKDDAEIDPPIGHPQPWIPVQESLQKTGRKGSAREDTDSPSREGADLGGAQVTPVRSVTAGVFRFEAWIEEAKAKFEVEDSSQSSFISSGA